MSTRIAVPLALNIFVGAFLLFQLQPIIARYILPWFGGSPAVWTSAMLFFQLMLLLGYAYTHWLVRCLTLKKQIILHTALLALAMLTLPITPTAALRPEGGAEPIRQIIWLLLVSVGLPYLMLSATTPLMQAWLARLKPHQEPYGHYALSNAGSILGLLMYPFVLEPLLGVQQQTYFWSAGFIIFCTCTAWVSHLIYRWAKAAKGDGHFRENTAQAAIGQTAHQRAHKAAKSSSGPHQASNTRKQIVAWFILSMIGVIILLAATNQLCKDVAVIPLLWILPLALYLGSFIVSFGFPLAYHRALWLPLLALTIGAVAYLLNQDYAQTEINLYTQILIYTLAVLASCTVCHGELYRLRPNAERLTLFYLTLSLGGAAGGLFVNLIAPLLFPGYWEFHLSLLLCLLIGGYFYIKDPKISTSGFSRLAIATAWALYVIIISVYFYNHIQVQREAAIYAKRNFYGVLRVYEQFPNTPKHIRELYHGRISHGGQLMQPALQKRPITYYGNRSGADVAIAQQRQLKLLLDQPATLRIGVIGQGVSTIAAHGLQGDFIRFYEIDPDVSDIANNYFSYLKHTPAEIDITHGDARISLEKAREANQHHNYDILIVDAFSGDGIPIHLLTREALGLYRHHLAPEGVIAIHISNLHFDLRPVVFGLSKDANMQAIWIEHWGKGPGEKSNDWVLVTASGRVNTQLSDKGEPWPAEDFEPILWTDNYANLFAALWADD